MRQGRAGIGWNHLDGSFQERAVLGPGDWVDVAGALSVPGTWVERVWCKSPCEFLAIPLDALFDAPCDAADLASAYGALLANRLRQLSETVQDMSTADVHIRLARWLIRKLPAGAGQDTSAEIQLTLTEQKKHIACQIGTTPESLSRALRRFVRLQVLEYSGNRFLIHDIDALQTLAWPEAQG